MNISEFKEQTNLECAIRAYLVRVLNAKLSDFVNIINAYKCKCITDFQSDSRGWNMKDLSISSSENPNTTKKICEHFIDYTIDYSSISVKSDERIKDFSISIDSSSLKNSPSREPEQDNQRSCAMAVKNISELQDAIKQMGQSYKWSSVSQKKINQSLDLLQARICDENFYLGVVGEFSSGKSTFINALIGLDILKEDILQGTTCAPTLLCYADFFDVEIYTNEKTPCIKFSAEKGKDILKQKYTVSVLNKLIEEARPFIYRYTADEKYAKSISKVIIRLPYKNPLFDNNIIIVDTPGINAENARHQEITEKVVRELCDLSIVLTPAPAPCSQTLMSFINKHLEYFHHHCICLATQIDRVREKERKRQIKFIADKFSTEEIVFSKIYPVAALYAVHEEDIGNSEDRKNLALEFSHTIEEISSSVKGNRKLVLSQNLQRLLTQIIDESVKPLLEKTSTEYTERYNELQSNKLVDYEEYIKNSFSVAMVAMEKIGITRTQISSIVSSVKTKMLSNLQSAISGANSKDELKKRMSAERIRSKINSYISTYIQPELNGYSQKVAHTASRQWTLFQNNFNQEFRNIAKNSSYPSKGNAGVSSIPLDNDSIISQLTNIANTIENEQSNTVGAAVVGGIIGTCIAAGPGTVLGAAIGGFLGSVFGKSLDEHKQEAKNQAKEITDNFASEISSALYSVMYTQIYAGHCNKLSSKIKKYAKNNKEIVENMISSERKQQEELRTKIKQIKSNLSLLKSITENSAVIITASH